MKEIKPFSVVFIRSKKRKKLLCCLYMGESNWESTGESVWVDLRVNFVLFFLRDLEVMVSKFRIIFVKVWKNLIDVID